MAAGLGSGIGGSSRDCTGPPGPHAPGRSLHSGLSMAMEQTGAGRTSWLRVLGWGAYLACSWTWCISMFLPVLLVRDYGVWGFVVFAVPNVIGAGAMGWVLRNGTG